MKRTLFVAGLLVATGSFAQSDLGHFWGRAGYVGDSSWRAQWSVRDPGSAGPGYRDLPHDGGEQAYLYRRRAGSAGSDRAVSPFGEPTATPQQARTQQDFQDPFSLDGYPSQRLGGSPRSAEMGYDAPTNDPSGPWWTPPESERFGSGGRADTDYSGYRFRGDPEPRGGAWQSPDGGEVYRFRPLSPREQERMRWSPSWRGQAEGRWQPGPGNLYDSMRPPRRDYGFEPDAWTGR